MQLHGIMRVMGLLCAIAALAMITPTAWASSSRSAMAATAVPNCSDNQGVTHPTRLLASAQPGEEKCLNQVIWTAARKQLFYARHRWMLSPRYKTWWQVPGQVRRNMARHSRAELRAWLAASDAAKFRLFDLQLTANFICIHGYEGSWTAHTGNGYYGGLQMDIQFQNTYGAEFVRRWGTADNWPVWAQLLAAKRAYVSGRGFGPWPNTARSCGLYTGPILVAPSWATTAFEV